MGFDIASALQSEVVKWLISGVVGPAICAACVWVYRRGTQIKVMYKQLTPDSGNSLADKIKSIDRKVNVVGSGLRFALVQTGALVYECDSTGSLVWASPSLADAFGLSQDEMLGRGWLSALDGSSERDRAWKNWIRAIETGIPFQDCYVVHNRRTGERFVMEATASATTDKGVSVHYWGVCNKNGVVREDADLVRERRAQQ